MLKLPIGLVFFLSIIACSPSPKEKTDKPTESSQNKNLIQNETTDLNIHVALIYVHAEVLQCLKYMY